MFPLERRQVSLCVSQKKDPKPAAAAFAEMSTLLATLFPNRLWMQRGYRRRQEQIPFGIFRDRTCIRSLSVDVNFVSSHCVYFLGNHT